MTKKLMENEMDKAQLILAAKSVLDDLQAMAEKMAKMEADGIMPLLDGIRLQFGAEFADHLNDVSSTALRASLEAVKNCKDQIGQVVTNMEQSVTGEGVGNDMANNIGVPETPSEPAPQAEPVAPEAEAGADESDLDDVFGSDEAPAGRAAKESAETDPAKMLRESADPDAFLIKEAVKHMKATGKSGYASLVETARKYSIDIEDMIAIARERLGKK